FFSFFFFSRSVLSLGTSRVMKAMNLPSGDQRKACTPFSSFVSFSASPPSERIIHIWLPLSRSARNATREPSDDHCGDNSPFSPFVSLMVRPPSEETNQMCEIRAFSFLSHSEIV